MQISACQVIIIIIILLISIANEYLSAGFASISFK